MSAAATTAAVNVNVNLYSASSQKNNASNALITPQMRSVAVAAARLRVMQQDSLAVESSHESCFVESSVQMLQINI